MQASPTMRIGELLVAAGLVTQKQINRALQLQLDEGGRIGDKLVAMGAINRETLHRVVHQVPAAPVSIADIGINETELLNLLLKVMVTGRLETLAETAAALALPTAVTMLLTDSAVRGGLLMVLAPGPGGSVRHGFTERGRVRANEALAASSYAGPVPVPLASYVEWLNRQKITNEAIDFPAIANAFSGLQIGDAFVDQIGPAICSGRPLLLYGPPGNGKTSTAQRLGRLFKDVIHVPHAVMVDGQVIRVFDPDLHVPAVTPAVAGAEPSGLLLKTSLRAVEFDPRWVACRRPFVVAGGELTLEMLDLRHEPTAHFYEAPLHLKAAGGVLLIDDFGRQMVTPTELLNRWIVPLENRVDYLKLHTGKSFRVPFETIVIFSTNLAPTDLMDPAFLRRIPYKLEVGAPSPELYRRIFRDVATANDMADEIDDRVIDTVIAKLAGAGQPLAAYQPRFLIEQIVAACRFKGMPLAFHPTFVDYAIDNLSVGGTCTGTAARS